MLSHLVGKKRVLRLLFTLLKLTLVLSKRFNRKVLCAIMMLFILLCHLMFVGGSLELSENEPCFSNFMSTSGLCTDPRKCDYFRQHRRELSICSFQQQIPIVCCPQNGVRNGHSGPSVHHVTVPTTLAPLNNRFNERISQRSKSFIYFFFAHFKSSFLSF